VLTYARKIFKKEKNREKNNKKVDDSIDDNAKIFNVN